MPRTLDLRERRIGFGDRLIVRLRSGEERVTVGWVIVVIGGKISSSIADSKLVFKDSKSSSSIVTLAGVTTVTVVLSTRGAMIDKSTWGEFNSLGSRDRGAGGCFLAKDIFRSFRVRSGDIPVIKGNFCLMVASLDIISLGNKLGGKVRSTPTIVPDLVLSQSESKDAELLKRSIVSSADFAKNLAVHASLK